MGTVYEQIQGTIQSRGAAFFLLVDPDHVTDDRLAALAQCCDDSAIDVLLVGGSLMMTNRLNDVVAKLRAVVNTPIILFPAGTQQLCGAADALLYLSLLSGRNPQYLIGEHVQASPIIRELGLEPIPTGYLLIESGRPTTAEYISNTAPIPRMKADIAMATALAGEYMGMQLIYLEGGSGADYSVPAEMVTAVSDYISLPVMVGGGIRTPELAAEKVEAGASIVVIGNIFESADSTTLVYECADAIHQTGKEPLWDNGRN